MTVFTVERSGDFNPGRINNPPVNAASTTARQNLWDGLIPGACSKASKSRALSHADLAERAVARPGELAGGTPRDIGSVAVVGGGLMGAGIAAACLSAGLSVTIIERDVEAAEAAKSRVAGLIDGALKRGKIDQAEHDAQLSAFTAHPERCLGLHFFSPAHIMKLLEVVKLPESSADTLATAFALARQLRKVAVLSGICDGFIGNRMLADYRRAAEYMLADGATPAQIDAAMRGFGMAMGPFEAQDMSGLQIAEANRRRQDATRPASERYVSIADQLCAAGRLGTRTGKGWYAYPDGSRTPVEDPEVLDIIAHYSAQNGITRRDFSRDEIQDQLLAVLANEGARIVEEGIAQDDAAVDVVKLHGYGFPRWRGGPMHAAETAGDETIRQSLDALDRQSPGSWVRAARFQ